MSATTESIFGPSWDGGVVLDIGGDVGALVIWARAELVGEEFELTPKDPTLPRVHSAVRQRLGVADPQYAAVYPQLAAGDYEIDRTGQYISIDGGRVAEISLGATD